MNPIIAALLAIGASSLVSVIAAGWLAFKPAWAKKISHALVAVAAGALLGDAFLHLLPEAYAGELAAWTPFLALGGILLMFILEKIVRWRHCHEDPHHEHGMHPIASMNLIGDGMHNFIDGMLVMAAFLADFNLGLATAAAVMLHEIPQEIGDIGVLVHAGLSPRRAVGWNLVSSLVAFAGAGVTLMIGTYSAAVANAMIPVAAGGFIYLAAADLIPELKEKTSFGHGLAQTACMLLGTAAMAALLLAE